MRIASGVTDQYIYFVGVDATDFTTRETGLSGFTVYRSRNGGAASVMTTPTVNETDTTNMPGVYELLLDEDTTIDAGDDEQEMCFHVTAAGMAPVTRTISIYRPKITAGETVTAASGIAEASVEGMATDVITAAALSTAAAEEVRDAVNGGAYPLDTDANGRIRVVDGTGAGEINTASGVVEANAVQISGDATTADNLQTLFDGVEGFAGAYAGPRGPGVYLNDAAANTNTANGVDGTWSNPVSTIAAAKTIADSLSVDRIYLVNDSAITLAATMTDYEFVGIGATEGNTVALASQDVTGSAFHNATVTGIQGGSGRAVYEDCIFGTATLYCHARRCGLSDGTTGITFSNNDDNILDACYSMVPGNTAPILICSAANLDLSVRHYSGGLEIQSSHATMTATLEFVGGQVIFNANCNANSAFTLRGMYSKTDNKGMSALTETAGWPYIQDDDTAVYDRTTDSLQALRDRGDTAWITGGGGGITDILNVETIIPTAIDLADTATVRIGMRLTNAVDDLPSTAEITPGTISIERKAIGGTSWSAVVTDAAMSEAAGHIYYDEVFDSGTGYAEGDSIRITFKSQKITVAANDYEIHDATGVFHQTFIRVTMRGTDNAATAAALATAQTDLDTLTGTDGATLATAQGNYAPAKAGDEMDLVTATEDGLVDKVWDEAQSGHVGAGSFGLYLDTEVSGVGGGSTTFFKVAGDWGYDETAARYYATFWLENEDGVITSGVSAPTVVGVYGENADTDLVSAGSSPVTGSDGRFYDDFTLSTDPAEGQPAYLVVTLVYATVTYRGHIGGVALS